MLILYLKALILHSLDRLKESSHIFWAIYIDKGYHYVQQDQVFLQILDFLLNKSESEYKGIISYYHYYHIIILSYYYIYDNTCWDFIYLVIFDLLVSEHKHVIIIIHLILDHPDILDIVFDHVTSHILLILDYVWTGHME